jgi:hypothetical protein
MHARWPQTGSSRTSRTYQESQTEIKGGKEEGKIIVIYEDNHQAKQA